MSQIQTGSFPRQDLKPTNVVLYDGPVSNIAQFTAGGVRVANLNIQPTLVQKWAVIGWSIRMRIGLQLATPGTVTGQGLATYGRLGDVWVGLVADASASNAGGVDVTPGIVKPGSASFPFDLSTFEKVFDGSSDPIRQPANLTIADQYQLIGVTYGLPSPIEVVSGTQLQMALVQTPTLAGPGMFGLIVYSCDFSVIYNDNTNAN